MARYLIKTVGLLTCLTLVLLVSAFSAVAEDFRPKKHETWLEIKPSSMTITLYRGKTSVKILRAEGDLVLDNGIYSLQHKQKNPLWYAPDSYFEKRQLKIPSADDQLRYRRGALGGFALYATTTFPIHAGPLWSEDVGGLRVSHAGLSSIYYMLPIGASIVVR